MSSPNLKNDSLGVKIKPNEALYYEEGNSVFVPTPQYYPQQSFDCTKKHAPEMYKCDRCDFQGYLKVNLQAHIELYHRSKDKNLSIENFCTESDTNYNMSSILKYHYCARCNFSTYSLLLFMKHNIENHNMSLDTNLALGASDADSEQPGPQRVYTKYRKFKGVKMFECNQCLVKTRSAYTLMKHIRLLHSFPDECQVFDCKECSFRTIDEVSFKKHLQRHDDEANNEWLQCPNCAYKTKHQRYFERHFKANHTPFEQIKWFPCEHCSYRAKNKWILKDHVIARHTAPEDINWWLCEFCAFKCKNRRNLKQHMQGKHKMKK